ncbi:unnamed protein product [Caenorhabditis nigoni]
MKFLVVLGSDDDFVKKVVEPIPEEVDASNSDDVPVFLFVGDHEVEDDSTSCIPFDVDLVDRDELDEDDDEADDGDEDFEAIEVTEDVLEVEGRVVEDGEAFWEASVETDKESVELDGDPVELNEDLIFVDENAGGEVSEATGVIVVDFEVIVVVHFFSQAVDLLEFVVGETSFFDSEEVEGFPGDVVEGLELDSSDVVRKEKELAEVESDAEVDSEK